MAEAKISRDIVFKAAALLQKKGEKVTADSVRNHLGMGSKTTVLKYLNEWKELGAPSANLNPVKLQAKLADQLKICENLSAELLNSRQLAASQSVQNAKLEARVLELEARLSEKELAQRETITHLTSANQQLKESFDKSMAMLAEHLRSINEQAITKVQEVGHHFDEKIIENKLAMRELSEQLAIKDKELKKLKSLETTGLLVRSKSQ